MTAKDFGFVPITEPVMHNVPKWIEANKKYFLPPVCNKMMHTDGQMKMFFVGGPNQRKDFHIEAGDELFYMLKGDMCLKVIEQGQHRNIPIKEGQIFLLPGKIAHSPQRQGNTIGLVLERERAEDEFDGLRYHVEVDGKPTLGSLYEEWFHVVDLGSQLAPVIKRFFASDQYKTGKPIPGQIPDKPPITLDFKTKLQDPFSLQEWINKNRVEIDENGSKKMFEGNFQFQVFVYGKGTTSDQCKHAETYIWQLSGCSDITIQGKVYHLNKDDSMLVPIGQRFECTQDAGSVCLVSYQDPTLAR